MQSIPHITFIYNRYKRASTTRKAVVEMRISYQRKQKYISTGIMLYPRQWKKERVVNIPDSILLNQQLDKMLMDVRQIIYIMTLEGHIDIFDISRRLDAMNKPKKRLLDFFAERAEVRKYGKAKDTKERYDRFIRLFKQYGEITAFEDISEANLIAYDKYLKKQGMKDYSKWQNYHRFLNSYINDAIDEGYLKKNPYKWININKGKENNGLLKYLTQEEFHKIQHIKLPTQCLEKIRNVFVFQTYTCLSYTDLKNFDYSKIITVKGMKVYTGKRDKTGKRFTIPLLKPAMDILKKYGNKLPVISNEKYNDYLKLIANAAGIEKPITTHWARHTGATLLLNEGVPMQVVSKICGHSSTKITEQVYAKLLDETVVDAIRKIRKE